MSALQAVCAFLPPTFVFRYLFKGVLTVSQNVPCMRNFVIQFSNRIETYHCLNYQAELLFLFSLLTPPYTCYHLFQQISNENIIRDFDGFQFELESAEYIGVLGRRACPINKSIHRKKFQNVIS